MPDDRSYERALSVTQWLAERVRDPLERLFTRHQFDRSLINNFGALCLDVDHGTELIVLKPYNPKIVTVSEPITWWNERTSNEGELREKAINHFGQDMNMRLVDGNPNDGINFILDELKTRVALVTMLSAHPSRLMDQWLIKVGMRADELLTPGGLMVLSIREEDKDYVDHILHTEYELKTKGPQNVSFEYYREGLTAAGSQYLVAQKLAK